MRLSTSFDGRFLVVAVLLLLTPVSTFCQAPPATNPAGSADRPPLYSSNFAACGFGNSAPGWLDLVDIRPSRNWAMDGNGLFRCMLKDYSGLIVYDGVLASGGKAKEIANAQIVATFTKTPDPAVSFGLAARVQDSQNYYAARFSGDNLLELIRVTEGKSVLLSSLPSMRRYHYPDEWKLAVATQGNLITAILQDEDGIEMARVDAKDDQYQSGWIGIACTTYAAAKSIEIQSIDASTPKFTAAEVATQNVQAARAAPTYPLFKPVANIDELNTPFEKLADSYDVIVAGGGTGGSAAAIQAARLGANVLLLEETDWLGGQMSAAGVTAMDESGPYGMRIVRERGIYREFHESMAAYYYTLNKDPFRGDRSFEQPNSNAGYEPNISRAGLYAMIAGARNNAKLDVSLRSRVVEVSKSGNTISGATIEVASGDGAKRKQIHAKIVIDATEYGDVIPLTGARYRVGNVTSDHIDLKAPVQDYTWTAVIHEYPQGIPNRLRIKDLPPDYGGGPKAFLKYKLWGENSWGKEAKAAGVKEFQYRVYFGYRSVPDTISPMYGIPSQHRSTLTSINGGNDYPVTVATIEDPQQRRIDERGGIYRTLCVIYYLQHDLGTNWSVAEEQGYDTPANRAKMAGLGIRPDLLDVACNLPQLPYVRESRRIIGVKTLVAQDLTRFENAKHFDTSVAMADYFMDLHGTDEAIEKDLDNGNVPKGGGPFQIPFEVFIPEKIDGFLPAEKNLSQSRLANGATRMQPSTMLTGQAAGAIAALAVKQHLQPRELNPKLVQAELLNAGSTLIQRWYSDVPWGTPIWRATQLLSLYRVIDRPGDIDKRATNLGASRKWGVDEPLKPAELHDALARLQEIAQMSTSTTTASSNSGTVSVDDLKRQLAAIRPQWKELAGSQTFSNAQRVTAGEFALLAAKLLQQ